MKNGSAPNVMLAKSESPCVLCVPCGWSALHLIHRLKNIFLLIFFHLAKVFLS